MAKNTNYTPLHFIIVDSHKSTVLCVVLLISRNLKYKKTISTKNLLLRLYFTFLQTASRKTRNSDTCNSVSIYMMIAILKTQNDLRHIFHLPWYEL